MKPMPWWGYPLAPFVAAAGVILVLVTLLVVVPMAMVVEVACELIGWKKPEWTCLPFASREKK